MGYSEQKQTVTLYLKKSLIERAHNAHLNISKIVTDILEEVLALQATNEEEMKLAIYNAELEQRESELTGWVAKMEPIQHRIDVLKRKIEEQTKVVGEIRRSEEIATYMKLLNAKIREANFDVNVVQTTAAAEIGRLQSLGILIDKAWLERQCSRVVASD